MKNNLQYLILLSLVVFSQCKQPESLMHTTVEVPQLSCEDKTREFPRSYNFVVNVTVSSIYYIKDSLEIDILPKTFEKDSSDLIHSINKHFEYSEMCTEMQVQGKVFFEISKDSIGNFTKTKVLRAFDNTCTELVSKELNRILKKAPIIGLKDEIESFILAIKIEIRRD